MDTYCSNAPHTPQSDVTVAQICRDTAISEGTFYRWKSKYGVNVGEAKRADMERENAKLKDAGRGDADQSRE